MEPDWTTILTHAISFIIGGAAGISINKVKNKKVIKAKTSGKNSPVYNNKGNVKTGDIGDGRK